MKLLIVLAGMLSYLSVNAQFPYKESFKNSSSPGLTVSGSAKLTAATGVDVAGDGYLRLTDINTNNVGYVYAQDSFPSQYGLTASFEFFCWKPGANNTNQADGMTFFLFDASVNAFRPGGTGGSLGYAQYYSTPGMAKGYLGISVDEFGNFSSASDGNKSGGAGQQRGSIAIRGPGNGKTTSDYVYQTGVIASDPSYNAGFQGFGQRYPDSTNASYRRLKIIMTPGSSAGASIGYKITIIIYKGGATVTPVTLINNFDYPFPAPAKLQFGLAASTGAITNYHEVRNLFIEATNTSALVAPTVTNDAGYVACQTQQCIMDVTANDACLNTGGTINRATVDLDPATTGRQTSFTDAGKGTYTLDDNGIVAFTPLAGYSGTSSVNYIVADTYGKTATIPGTINVVVSSDTGPALAMVDPAGACFPATVDITNASLKTTTTAGAGFSYFASLTDANNNTSDINAAATGINQSGTYYVRETLNGCSTIKPIVVQVNTSPTTANAGPDQNFCTSSGSQSTTLLANNPDVGVGAWTQVSGPSTATITYPDAATSPLSNMAKGMYLFRWKISNGACAASIDDIQITVGVAANAGSNQTIVNAASASLSANAAAPGAGIWSQISGSTTSFNNTADPLTTVTGLTPGNTYVFQWKITNGGCNNTSQVTVLNVLNTIANAGPDRTETALLPFVLAGNTADEGNTGTWTIINKPTGTLPAIALPNIPAPIVTGISLVGDYVFRWTMANGSFSNYDEVTIHVSTPLPVLLASFNGIQTEGTNRLQWKTLSEDNLDHFELERSEDGVKYKQIALVAARDNHGAMYHYDDAMPNLPAACYRLKMVDRDGSIYYSFVVRITLRNKPDFSVVTNPFSSNIIAQAYLEKPGIVKLKLYDNSGRMIRVRSHQLGEGISVLSVTDLSALPAGVYYLEIVGDQLHEKLTLLKRH